MNDLSVQVLVDRACISDVIHNYAAGVDLKDWGLFRSCFTDDLEADFSSVLPTGVHHGADSWVDLIRNVLKDVDQTQHIITNHSHEINGNASRSRSYLQAQHVCFSKDGGEQHFKVGGFYDYDFVRTARGWRIKRYALHTNWAAGNPALLGSPGSS
jgi:SnoaL-like protein